MLLILYLHRNHLWKWDMPGTDNWKMNVTHNKHIVSEIRKTLHMSYGQVTSELCRSCQTFTGPEPKVHLLSSALLSGINTLRPRQNGRHFADDIFKWIFLNENAWIPIKILLKFVPLAPINNIPAWVQMMAWRRPSDKPLSGPMIG